MLAMDQIETIKELQIRGLSPSEIARKLSVDWKTVVKYMQQENYSPKPPVVRCTESKLDPWKPVVDGWLEEDRKVRYKQRHTAKRIFDRLKEEHPEFTGSYPIVQRYVKSVREAKKQTAGFLELVWPPGEAQVDFGEADFDTPAGRIPHKYLCTSFPHSNGGLSQVFGGETAECVCQGLQDIFEYIGGVPTRLIFDNATGVGRRIGEQIRLTELFRRFKAHHGFELSFCNPASGHEKGNVERKVGYVRSNLFVPVPYVDDLPIFNRRLLEQGQKLMQKPHYKKQLAEEELFSVDRAALLPLPRQRFNVCRYEYVRADGYGKVCLDGKHYYSTMPEWAGQTVLLGIRAHTIDILRTDGSLLVSHPRSFSSERSDHLDHSTSLALLLKNAGAWRNSGIRSTVSEPLRQLLDEQTRSELRKSLQLLSTLSDRYGFDTAVQAMEEAVKRGSLNLCDTAVLAARLAGYGLDTPPELGPDLAKYDRLLQIEGGELQ
jgi:transposase